MKKAEKNWIKKRFFWFDDQRLFFAASYAAHFWFKKINFLFMKKKIEKTFKNKFVFSLSSGLKSWLKKLKTEKMGMNYFHFGSCFLFSLQTISHIFQCGKLTVYVNCSEARVNEKSECSWEFVIRFALARKLDTLVEFIDWNLSILQ